MFFISIDKLWASGCSELQQTAASLLSGHENTRKYNRTHTPIHKRVTPTHKHTMHLNMTVSMRLYLMDVTPTKHTQTISMHFNRQLAIGRSANRPKSHQQTRHKNSLANRKTSCVSWSCHKLCSINCGAIGLNTSTQSHLGWNTKTIVVAVDYFDLNSWAANCAVPPVTILMNNVSISFWEFRQNVS